MRFRLGLVLVCLFPQVGPSLSAQPELPGDPGVLVGKSDETHLPPGPPPPADWAGRKIEAAETGIALVWIPAGDFQMGSTTGGSADERPATRVRLTRGFWLGRTELTQGQWTALMGDNPSHFRGPTELPVERAGWPEAMEFCRRLTQRERAAGRVPAGYEYRLPTEAEWEYACRAGATDDYGGAGDLGQAAWYGPNSGKKTHPVGLKLPNLWGLYDMHGNVWEWTFDLYGRYPGGEVADPSGPARGGDRVIRGGGWVREAELCRCAHRRGHSPGHLNDALGFRVALGPRLAPEQWPSAANPMTGSGAPSAPTADTAGCNLENFHPRRVVPVSNLRQMETALAAAQPGDLIEASAGDYADSAPIEIHRSGTARDPIVLRAKPLGGARIVGRGGFVVRGAAYVGIEGFELAEDAVPREGAALILDGCHQVRFSRNTVHLHESTGLAKDERLTWMEITGEQSHHNRFDHNLVEEKRHSGVMLLTSGSARSSGNRSTQYDRIDHNYFRNFHHGTENGYETVRLGSSTFSHTSGFILVEQNLFENCDGENEIISVKTSQNTIRHNTFLNCSGQLSLRNCHECVAEGNFFLNPAGKPRAEGIRFFGQDHRIVNNYFEGLTGSALIIRTGDIERRTRPLFAYEDEDGGKLVHSHWGAYQRPEDALVAFNTVINCAAAIELGDRRPDYPLPPRNCTIADNLLVCGRGVVIKELSPPQNFIWLGNLVQARKEKNSGAEQPALRSPAKEGAGVSSALGMDPGPEGFRFADLKLIRTGTRWQPGPESPALGAALGQFPIVREDVAGRPRESEKTVGADEPSTDSAPFRPLAASDVGPRS